MSGWSERICERNMDRPRVQFSRFPILDLISVPVRQCLSTLSFICKSITIWRKLAYLSRRVCLRLRHHSKRVALDCQYAQNGHSRSNSYVIVTNSSWNSLEPGKY